MITHRGETAAEEGVVQEAISQAVEVGAAMPASLRLIAAVSRAHRDDGETCLIDADGGPKDLFRREWLFG